MRHGVVYAIRLADVLQYSPGSFFWYSDVRVLHERVTPCAGMFQSPSQAEQSPDRSPDASNPRLVDPMPCARPMPRQGSQYVAVEASAVTRALLELDAGANCATPMQGISNHRSETPVAGNALFLHPRVFLYCGEAASGSFQELCCVFHQAGLLLMPLCGIEPLAVLRISFPVDWQLPEP